MITTKVPLSEIQFIRKPCDEIVESIRIRGVAIPVIVNKIDEGYECVDGNKRLSSLEILSNDDDKFFIVPIMIQNDYSKAGSAFWGDTQNRH